MVKNAKVVLIDDYSQRSRRELLKKKLESAGVQVTFSPPTIKGTKRVYSDEEIEEHFKTSDVVMGCPRSIADSRFLESIPGLLGIVYPGIGVETLDVAKATELGIAVGYGAIAENYLGVAEFAVGLIIMLSHCMLDAVAATYGKKELNNGEDNKSQLLLKKKVGLIGFGRIGRAVAERLKGFDVELLAYSPTLTQDKAPDYVKVCTKDEVVRESDILGIYVVINDDTKNMINREVLAKMKPTAYLVNIARGEAVNEEDLYEALKNGVIRGAALDVYQTEPLPSDSKLRKLDNVILTPHCAGRSRELSYAALENEYNNIMNILQGKLPRCCKNPEVEEKFYARYKSRI